jgi:hypothetical protein
MVNAARFTSMLLLDYHKSSFYHNPANYLAILQELLICMKYIDYIKLNIS